MGKKLSPVDVYYIEQHREKMSIEGLAKLIGCTPRTIYNYVNKTKGEARTEQGREDIKNDALPSSEPNSASEELSPPPISIPPPGMQLIAKRKNGSSAAIAMTKEMSEIGDEIFKKNTTKKNPDYLFVMNPDKED